MRRASSTGRAWRTSRRSSPDWPRVAGCSGVGPRRSSACATPPSWVLPCARRGCAYPSTFSAADAPRQADRSRRWLRKPVRGGGGRGVREWRGGALAGDVVVQERIAGLPCSAAAVANGRSAVVLGVSEQLVGRRALGGRGYAWCGNVVPPRLGEAQQRALTVAARAICAHLAAAFGLRGLFGVDLVWDGERAWVVEVNPRPTGSLESVEAAHGVGVVRRPRGRAAPGACRRSPPLAPRPAPRARRFSSPPGRCASATRVAGRRAASATCLTPVSGSRRAIRSAPSSPCRTRLTRSWPTSRRAPPACAPSWPYPRPGHDALRQRSCPGAR